MIRTKSNLDQKEGRIEITNDIDGKGEFVMSIVRIGLMKRMKITSGQRSLDATIVRTTATMIALSRQTTQCEDTATVQECVRDRGLHGLEETSIDTSTKYADAKDLRLDQNLEIREIMVDARAISRNIHHLLSLSIVQIGLVMNARYRQHQILILWRPSSVLLPLLHPPK